MKLLLLEDDRQLNQNFSKQFEKSGFAVDAYFAYNAAWEQLAEFSHEYDCVVVDINLPDGNGFELCKQLRTKGIETPLMIMTAREAIDDKLHGLNLGADDYVTKPVDFRELLARVRAIIRRNSKHSLPTHTIADLIIDPQSQRVSRAGHILELTSKEFAVLEFLARHQDEVVTRTMIMEHVWGSDFETFSNVIDVYIRNLRRKIDTNYSPKLLHTIRGSGYRLSDIP